MAFGEKNIVDKKIDDHDIFLEEEEWNEEERNEYDREEDIIAHSLSRAPAKWQRSDKQMWSHSESIWEEPPKSSLLSFVEPFMPNTLRRRVAIQEKTDSANRSSIACYRIQEELDRLPKNEKGEIEEKDLKHFAERLIRHKDIAKLQQKFSLYSILGWIVAMLVVLGVIILAIQVSKDTTVSTDGELVATDKSGTAVMVKANGGMHIHADTSPLSSIPMRRFRRSLRRMLTPESAEDDYMDYDTVALVSKDEVNAAYEAVTDHDTAIHVDFTLGGSEHNFKVGTNYFRKTEGAFGNYSIENIILDEGGGIEHVVNLVCHNESSDCDVVAGSETTNLRVRRLGDLPKRNIEAVTKNSPGGEQIIGPIQPGEVVEVLDYTEDDEIPEGTCTITYSDSGNVHIKRTQTRNAGGGYGFFTFFFYEWDVFVRTAESGPFNFENEYPSYSFLDKAETKKMEANITVNAKDGVYPPINVLSRTSGMVRAGNCFSPNSSVVVEGKGVLTMKDLSIGDKVLTSGGTFSEVYTFLRRVPATAFQSGGRPPAHFLKLVTEKDGVIELSKKHYIYRANSKLPVQAAVIKAGEYVMYMGQQDTVPNPVRVLSIEDVYYHGAYAPATADATIVVGGIVASTYSSPRHMASDFMIQVGSISMVHRTQFASIVTTPVRLACTYIWPGLCAMEDPDAEMYFPFEKFFVDLLSTSAGTSVVRLMEAMVVVGFSGILPLSMASLYWRNLSVSK